MLLNGFDQATVGTILTAEMHGSAMPELLTQSVSANNETRRWIKVQDFISEVSEARILDGVHYRNSTEVGNVMGSQIGQLAVSLHF